MIKKYDKYDKRYDSMIKGMIKGMIKKYGIFNLDKKSMLSIKLSIKIG